MGLQSRERTFNCLQLWFGFLLTSISQWYQWIWIGTTCSLWLVVNLHIQNHFQTHQWYQWIWEGGWSHRWGFNSFSTGPLTFRVVLLMDLVHPLSQFWTGSDWTSGPWFLRVWTWNEGITSLTHLVTSGGHWDPFIWGGGGGTTIYFLVYWDWTNSSIHSLDFFLCFLDSSSTIS